MRPAPGPVYICDGSDPWETSLPAEAPRPAPAGHNLAVQSPSNCQSRPGTSWAGVDSWNWSGFRPSEKYRWACIAQMPVGLGGVGRYQAIASAWIDGKSPRTTVSCQGMRILLLASPLHFSRTPDGDISLIGSRFASTATTWMSHPRRPNLSLPSSCWPREGRIWMAIALWVARIICNAANLLLRIRVA